MSRPIPVEEMVRQFGAHHSNSHIFRIDNLSLFEKYQFKEIESSIFEIGFHKWKLVVYPNGNENDNGKDHVSLYLETQDSGSQPLPSSWEVKFRYQLFVLNQFRQYWCAKEGNVVFNASNRKQGFARLISLAEFGNPKKGYLVDGCSLFGVKILGLTGTKVGTTNPITLIEKPPNNKFSWKMMKFSMLDRYAEYQSDEFVTGNRKWKISVYPRGSKKDADMLSVYLRGEGFVNNTPNTKTYARFRLRVLDQTNGKHVTNSCSYSFPVDPMSHGSNMFMPLKDLRNPSNYVVNDTLFVEVEVDVVSMNKYP